MHVCRLLLPVAFGLVAARADAAFHVMQVEQIVGGISGTTNAQAIQLRLRSSGQQLVSNASLWVADSSGLNRILLLNIASDVSNGAAGARILLATSAFTTAMINGGSTNFVPDFTLASAIPANYFAAGRLTFEADGGSTATPGTIYWSLAWGDGAYTGSTLGDITNDADGNFGPAFGLALATNSRGLLFTGAASSPSTSNSADYLFTTGNAIVTKNNGTAFTVIPEPGTAATFGLGVIALAGMIIARRASGSRPGPKV
jgi:hypothetical protein